eukprot:CAMPEP_0203755786 /NCGR_PEP_ID=MMETSP0098-20131031/9169_1 /ASSEMBLY_ACC=CAM_ASM_000208 /TAXON_ID=96639 /ORGANISM=" , Strain NY0313808BC1" /LENGTH=151 /DNA_ID=CAMNT_0050647381 /DNA_START=52 /DNA_END=503 /DNA_ORIENTATION=-
MAFAADMALDSFLALITAAPRCCTVFTKSFLTQLSSLMASRALTSFPPMLTTALLRSGYWVEEWFPQITQLRTALFGTPRRAATCACALFWSSLVRAVKFWGGMEGAYFLQMKALVFAGFPTTTTLMFFLATLSIACPWDLKIFTLAASRS